MDEDNDEELTFDEFKEGLSRLDLNEKMTMKY